MYDVNPLGPLMHLKELERQAAAASRGPVRAGAGAMLRGWMAALVAQCSRCLAEAKPVGRKRA
jgi:hypothetical protein